MKVIITTNLEARKQQLLDEIDSYNEHIKFLSRHGDPLINLYQERLDNLISELYDLEAD